MAGCEHVKVRDHERVVSKALVVAYAVHETWVREVIGLDIGEVESGGFWIEFLRSLRARGLDGVRLAVSDHHEGLKHAMTHTEKLFIDGKRLLHLLPGVLPVSAALTHLANP